MTTIQRQCLACLSKHGVSTWGGSVEPVQKRVMGHIDEKLAATRFGLSGVGHGKRSGFIGDLLVGLSDLIGNTAPSVARVGFAIRCLEGGVGIRSTGARTRRIGVLGVRTTKLGHKVGNHTVKVNAIIKATVGKICKVADCDWHLVWVKLGLEGSHGSLKGCNRHCCYCSRSLACTRWVSSCLLLGTQPPRPRVF